MIELIAGALLAAGLVWFVLQPIFRRQHGEGGGGGGGVELGGSASYCDRCGTALEPDSRFCSRCGAPVAG